MLRAIIIDDESSNRELLGIMLADFCPDVSLAGEADSLESGKKIINEINPDLVFLDIEMPSGTGFDLLREIPNRNFDVIFTTAYNQYALLAFKFSATDYLLKPIDPSELTDAVEKVNKKRTQKSSPLDTLQVLLENLGKHGEPPRKIILSDQTGFTAIEIKEIIRLFADGSYTSVIMTGDRKIISSKPIGVFEEMLETQNFLRIHHSHLINLNFVEKYTRGQGGFVIMADKSELEVSRRKKDEFISRMGGKE